MLLSHEKAFEVLLLQAADKGRGPILFGDSLQRVHETLPPFLVGESFPELYLEFPLIGDPFLDVTTLYGDTSEGLHINSPLVEGCEKVMSYYAHAPRHSEGIAFGFEIDCETPTPHAAGIHFQPREQSELVTPFCEALGEPARAELYYAQNARMPEGWKLSFFGIFRGRSEAPLRVCGYHDQELKQSYQKQPSLIADALTKAGFEAFDDTMLEQASRVFQLAPQCTDFQLDVNPDGSLSDVFAIDLRFDHGNSQKVMDSFSGGINSEIAEQLQEWGIADSRIDLVPDMTFTRGLPLPDSDGKTHTFGFWLMPGWLKVRWRNGVLQSAKMYMRAGAGPLSPNKGSKQ